MNVLSFLREHKLEVCIFVVAFAVRFFYLGVSYDARDGNLIATVSGADGYYAISENLIHGRGFSSDTQPPYTLNSFRPPIFPYFLAVTYALFHNYWGTVILQILIGSTLPLLGMRLVRYLTTERRISIAVGIFLTFEPLTILFSTFFYSETVFTFLFFLSLLFLFRYFKGKQFHWLMFSAFFIGFATLTKPVAEYIPLIIIGVLFWDARKNISKQLCMHAGAYGLIFLLTLSPWLYRNYEVFGVAGITGQKEAAIYNVLVPSVLAVEHGTSFGQEYDAHLQAGGVDVNQTNLTASQGYIRKALPVLLSHPVALTLLTGNTALSFFTHDGVLDVLRHINVAPSQRLGKPAVFLLFSDPIKLFGFIRQLILTPAIFVLAGRIMWIGITLAFFFGAWRYLCRQGATASGITALVIVFYFMLTTLTIGLAVNARYRLPVNALMLTFAVYGVSSLMAARDKKNLEI